MQFMWQKERGAVLLTVLLFLLIITMLVFAMLNTSLLETKMSNNHLEKMRLFYAAEIALKQKEQLLLDNPVQAPMQQICGVDFYKVTGEASDENGGAVILESVFAKVGDISKCNPKPKVQISGRQSFIIDNS